MPTWLPYLARQLINISDQQLIMSTALQVTMLVKLCNLSTYHLGVITAINGMSLPCYSSAVIAVGFDSKLRRQPKLSLIRAITFIVTISAAIAQLIYFVNSSDLSGTKELDLAPIAWPAICFSRVEPFMPVPIKLAIAGAVSMAIAQFCISTFAALVGIDRNILPSPLRGFDSRLQILLNTDVVLSCITMTFLNAQAFGSVPSGVIEPGARESDWGFGQVLPLLLLLLPVFGVFSDYKDE